MGISANANHSIAYCMWFTGSGDGGCGVYQVRPRLGIIGMLAGWWHVKLSSGCPLAQGGFLPPTSGFAGSPPA